MVDEKKVEVKKGIDWFWAIVIIGVGLMLMAFVGWSYYNDGFDKGSASCPNVSINSSNFDAGFNSGVEYGLNMSVQQMLYYAQNCSVVRINYTGNVYGFVDATCVVALNNRS